MKCSRILVVLAWCVALAGSLSAPAVAAFSDLQPRAHTERGVPAHDEEQGECPESSEAASEDNDAKHFAAYVYLLPAPAALSREWDLSARPRYRAEKPFLPPPNTSASLI